jgi:hypothetical protein
MTALQIEFNLSKTHDTIENTRTNYFFRDFIYKEYHDEKYHV